jgi:hypothetical protein
MDQSTQEFIESFAEDQIQYISRKMGFLLLNKANVEKDMKSLVKNITTSLEEKKLNIGEIRLFIYEPCHVCYEFYEGFREFLVEYLSDTFIDYVVSDLMAVNKYKFKFVRVR